MSKIEETKYTKETVRFCCLAFAKYISDNYQEVLDKYVDKNNVIKYEISLIDVSEKWGKTLEQLFNEWNNLK